MKIKSIIAAILLAASSAFAQFTVVDTDGNSYDTINIGNQVWLNRNLNVSKYNNGDLILTGLNNNQWITANYGAYSTYNNSLYNDSVFGKLYNYYVVTDPRGVCPIGWRIPSESDWSILKNYLGGYTDAGKFLNKQNQLFFNINVDSVNFNGLFAGNRRYLDGAYSNLGSYGFWWSSNICQSNFIGANVSVMSTSLDSPNFGISIRCMQDPCNLTSNTITPDGPTTFCAGNYVNLTSDAVSGTYQWKKNGVNVTSNGTSRTYKATATGSYTCVATCNGAALTSNAIQVTTKTNAFASLTASGATSFCAGDSVTLSCTNLGSNYSVQWYRTNVSIENATNYSLVVKQPGTYKVVTKNLTTGCSRISGSAITTNVNCRIANNNPSEPTSNDINEESRTLAPELSQGVNLFPNPNNGSFKFTYEGEVEGEGTIQVINMMGQTIYQSQVTAEDNRINKEIFLGDHYQKGIYIVRLLINGGQNDSRMIVQ